MKKAIIIVSLIFLLIAGKKGISIYRKLRHAQRLKISVAKFKLLNITSEFGSQIILKISNFSSTKFKVNQISIDAFTSSGELLARQKKPLANPFDLTPNSNSNLPIDFAINLPVLISEINKIGGLSSITANYITSSKYGLTIVLKGFVKAENLTLNINETIKV